MNHIVNDKGETVEAVGAPGSPQRMKAVFPALIENINKCNSLHELIFLFSTCDQKFGAFSKYEIEALICCSKFTNKLTDKNVLNFTCPDCKTLYSVDKNVLKLDDNNEFCCRECFLFFDIDDNKVNI